MTVATRLAIESAFGCPVVNAYGASEALSIAYGCAEGLLHVNADWIVLEPVDRDHRPTPPGEPSHTVLLTNLATRVQPLVRYELGDSITVKAGPCECGSPLPAIQVEGRRDDIVSLTASDGRVVRLLPLALSTVVEEAAGLHRFQIRQTAADRLALRLDPDEAADPRAAWEAASRGLREYLARQSLANVTVALEHHLPARSDPRQVCVVCAEPPRAFRPRLPCCQTSNRSTIAFLSAETCACAASWKQTAGADLRGGPLIFWFWGLLLCVSTCIVGTKLL
jgi:phenylacetate-coenzyme A ligase PaaK-like adenylate-forming protein